MTDNGGQTAEFLKLEYTTLRGELAKRIEARQRILEITLGSAGAILAVYGTGADITQVLLAYPILVLLLAANWLPNGLAVKRLASYLRMEVEPRFECTTKEGVDAVGYETWLATSYDAPNESRIGTVASVGTFLGLQVLVFSLGRPCAAIESGVPDSVLPILGGLAIVMTLAG